MLRSDAVLTGMLVPLQVRQQSALREGSNITFDSALISLDAQIFKDMMHTHPVPQLTASQLLS